MTMKRTKRIVFGIVLILLGITLALSVAGVLDLPALPEGLSVWRIVLGVALLFCAIDLLLKLEFTGAFLFLGLITLMLEEFLSTFFVTNDADWFNNWMVMLIALMIGIGLDLIFKGFRHNRRFKKRKNTEHSAFGDSVSYIDSAKFKNKSISNMFGETEIRFENVELYQGDAELYIENKFGETIVYVPSEWEVRCTVDSGFGEVNIDKDLTIPHADGNGKLLKIMGRNRFGEVNIKAV